MKPRKPKVVGFLTEPLPYVYFIVCPNFDNWHGADKLFLRYIIYWKGIILDEPDFDTAQEVLETMNLEVVMVYGPCRYCVRKGITGPAGWNAPPHFKPDPFEKNHWAEGDEDA